MIEKETFLRFMMQVMLPSSLLTDSKISFPKKQERKIKFSKLLHINKYLLETNKVKKKINLL